MAFEKFNSVGGYSVGIPAVDIIDQTGNLISNVYTLTGSVTANAFYYSNGVPLTSFVAGNTTQIQFNNGGVFGASPSLTFNSTSNTLSTVNFTANGNVNLGNVATLKILGGVNGYFLQTDGTGNLTWSAGGGGGGNGSPGGSNHQVQFNDAGTFGGDAGFVYDKNIDLLTVGNANVTGNITATYYIGNGSLLTGIDTNLANYVKQPNQANITSLGTLDYLDVLGDIFAYANVDVQGNVEAGNVIVSSNISANSAEFTNRVRIGANLTVNANATMRVFGNINTAGSPNITLGTLSNIKISGGVNGYVLTTDGTGNLSWTASGGGGGNGNPGGSNTQVQYNDNGSFGGDPYFVYDNFNKVVQIGGNLIANSLQLGAGVYKWSTSQVYFATTASTAPAQVLYSIPVANLSGVDFEIFGTEPAGPSRQSCKISALYYDSTIAFNEYASLFVNGGVGNFEVDYDAGNIITPASLKLKVTPNTINPVTYKMLITVYAG